MASIFCFNCGEELPEGTKFCPNCGQLAAGEPAATPTEPVTAASEPQYQPAAPEYQSEPQYQPAAPQYQAPEQFQQRASQQYAPPVQTPPVQAPPKVQSGNPFVAPQGYAGSVPPRGSAYAPIGAWGYLGILLLFCVPLVGLIFMIVWACGGCRKVAKRNLSRAFLLVLAIGVVLALAAYVLLLLNVFPNVSVQLNVFGTVIDLATLA